MQHRQDIQIMRGVAVSLVVLFHLDMPFLESGFLGVDIFFVISGFLMALLYRRGEALDFYLRRASRLLPAYFFIVIATVLLSTWLTLPTEHVQVVEQGIFAAFFSSNIGFWMQNSYFSKAEFNPLLHLWSLGVEIQFYLLVPLLAWLSFRNRFAMPVIFVGSLAACLALVAVSPKTAFFMMPFRVWQFLLGAGVAHYLTANGAVGSSRSGLGLAALAMVVMMVAFFSVDGQIPDPLLGHPGAAAMIVTLATAVILACGLPEWFQSGVLGRVLQRLGDWSYSIYLVHFPVIVLVLYQPFSGTLLSPGSGMQVFFIIALIGIFSAICYGVFERRSGWIGRPKGIACMVVILVIASLVSSHLNRVRYTDQEQNVFGAFEDRSAYRCGKLVRIFNPKAMVCELTEGDMGVGAPAVLLVGDSHADSMKTTFARVARERGYRFYFIVSNSPLLGGPDGGRIVSLAKDLDVSGVVLHYASRNGVKAYESGFSQLALEADIPTAWLLPVPAYGGHVPRMIWDNLKSGVDFNSVPENMEMARAFKGRIMESGVVAFDPYPAFCADKCAVMDSSMRPFYFDAAHLTLTGAEQLSPVVGELIDWLALQGLEQKLEH